MASIEIMVGSAKAAGAFDRGYCQPQGANKGDDTAPARRFKSGRS
jgi:hypothetical protein